MDCAGLLSLVGQELSLTDYDVTTYDRGTHGFDFLRHLRAAGFKRKGLQDRQIADVLVFRDGNSPCHVAILSDKQGVEHIIHSSAAMYARKVVEEEFAHEWRDKVIMCLAWPGVDN